MQGRLVIDFSAGSRGDARLNFDPAVNLARLLEGRTVDRVLATIPLIFNLCRKAQTAAAQLALGIPLTVSREELRKERLCEGFAKLGVFWPMAMGMQPMRVPGTSADTREMAQWLFGDPQTLPAPADHCAWISSGTGIASLGGSIESLIAAGEGVNDCPPVSPRLALEAGPFENSPAQRNAGHPLMQTVEERFGRGPLWRYFGLIVDMQTMLDGKSPRCELDPETGAVLADAPRGTYALRTTVEDGVVTRFERRTPTDHMTARGGPLEQSLASLRKLSAEKVALLTAIIDPCVPVVYREAAHA